MEHCFYENWRPSTFEDYYTDNKKFVNGVINFFFDPLENIQAVDENQEKYCFYMENKGERDYYFLKPSDDDDDLYDIPLKNYKRFVNYYCSSVKLKRFYNLIELKCLENNQVLPYLPEEDCPIIIDNSTTNINNINNNIVLINESGGDLFGLTDNSMEKIVGFVDGEPKIWNSQTELLKELRDVIAYNVRDNNYTIISLGGYRIVEEGWFEGLSYFYKNGDETICSSFKDLIQANKMLFKVSNLYSKKNHLPSPVQILNKNMADEIEFVEEWLTKNLTKFQYRTRGIHFGVDYKKILNISKIFAEVLDNCGLLSQMIKILGDFGTSANRFTPMFKNYIRDHSKKYEVRLDENGHPLRGTNKESLIFLK